MHIQNGPVLHAVTRENTAEIHYLSSIVVSIVQVTKETSCNNRDVRNVNAQAHWIVLEH